MGKESNGGLRWSGEYEKGIRKTLSIRRVIRNINTRGVKYCVQAGWRVGRGGGGG